ncbi:hypothetical protein ABH926_004103 [Catenulispora sp. GP43]|uniref:peptidoglycan-binding domain-containing protein n=1 Tax=Catenulispora sp. GP43 TaxID=3156263 RepID=UPI0035119441
MSSPDNNTPWGTPQSPSGAAQPPYMSPHQSSSPQDPGQPAPPPMAPPGSPAPPPMMSPYGMPLNGGGPEGPGGFGPGDQGPGDLRRRRTLIASALAVVAVVGIGGAVAFMSGGSPHKKPDAASLAGAGASESGSNAGNGSGVVANGNGKPDGDDIAAGSTNGAQGDAMPGNPASTSTGGATTGGQQGQSTNGGGSTSASGGGTSTHPGSPATSHSGAPAPSNPATSAPKPITPVTTAPPPPKTTTTAAKPSSDCTYLDLPASQMPDIKQGTTNTNAVKQLQCLLKKSELGIKPLAIDGSWGSDTQSALTAFQGCNNSPTVHSPGGTPPYPKLAVDGDAGPQTWADLYFWDNQYFNGTAYYCNGTR